jgi:hypothetical protein
MEKIEGLNITKLGFTPLHMGDLLSHEGPLLSHFIDKNNPYEHYLYKWVDNDEVCNRWLVAKLSEDNLKDFFNKKVNLRQIITQNAFVYILDLSDYLTERTVLILNTNDVPESYLPTHNAFFNEKQYEPYALRLKETLMKADKTGVFNYMLEELMLIKKQQHEANHLLQTIVNKVLPSQSVSV